MRCSRCSKIYFYLFFASLIFLTVQLFLEIYREDQASDLLQQTATVLQDSESVIAPIILWWAPITGYSGSLKQCGNMQCFFTTDRRYRNHILTKAFAFYGSNFDIFDLPLPREWKKYSWALLHEESPKNVPAFSHSKALTLFNYTATFSRYSHVPLTLQYLESLEVLIDTKYYVPLEHKNKLLSELAPIIYVYSDCDTPLERDTYVTELMKYIKVDSYGACLQNKKLPEHLSHPIGGMDAEEFFNIIAQYKFTLAFENAVCDDYITEKLWRTLIVGSVPVYMGSPSVKDWLPNNNSAIMADDFNTPKELAEFLLNINRDDQKYEEFLQHKLANDHQKITNQNLKQAMTLREWGVDGDLSRDNMVDVFECFICKTLHVPSLVTSVDIHHYYCPVPVSPITKKENVSNFWRDQWYMGRSEAEVLRNYIDQGVNNFTQDDFYNKVGKQLSKKTIFY